MTSEAIYKKVQRNHVYRYGAMSFKAGMAACPLPPDHEGWIDWMAGWADTWRATWDAIEANLGPRCRELAQLAGYLDEFHNSNPRYLP